MSTRIVFSIPVTACVLVLDRRLADHAFQYCMSAHDNSRGEIWMDKRIIVYRAAFLSTVTLQMGYQF